MTDVRQKPIERLGHGDLIDQLENVIAGKDIAHQEAMLRRVTDLFALGSGKLSDEQIALFDIVMGRLVESVELSARAFLGHSLAMLPDAPPEVIRRLALDDAIDVARPVLSNSVRVDDATLVESAKTKSQEHLFAISRRDALVESVTDVLVERGNQQVVLNTAKNPGAAFSESGYSTLVQRSSNDRDLAVCVWSRAEIPRQHLLKLFADASESVKRDFMKRDPRKANLVAEVVAQAAKRIQKQTRDSSATYAAAQAFVRSLHGAGNLTGARLAEFARSEKFEETVVALSIVCNLPVGLIERAFMDDRSEQIIVLAKGAGLSWETVREILLLQAKTKNAATDKIDRYFDTYMQLTVESARKTIDLYRKREHAQTP
jgi:uncharacterized protein (DUF2336 family)